MALLNEQKLMGFIVSLTLLLTWLVPCDEEEFFASFCSFFICRCEGRRKLFFIAPSRKSFAYSFFSAHSKLFFLIKREREKFALLFTSIYEVDERERESDRKKVLMSAAVNSLTFMKKIYLISYQRCLTYFYFTWND